MTADLGKLLLRFTVAGLMLFHGIEKATQGISFIKSLVVKQGLPEVLAYGFYLGEIFAPLFLIIGWKRRGGAGIIAFNMLMAIYLTKMDALLTLGKHGEWAIEVPMFFLLVSVVIMLIGSGKYAVSRD